MEDVILLTKHLMQSNNVQPVMRLGENLPWALMGRNPIKQVVINLVNNALYAMPEGGQLVSGNSLPATLQPAVGHTGRARYRRGHSAREICRASSSHSSPRAANAAAARAGAFRSPAAS